MSEQIQPPKELKENRNALLKAELAVLLHDLGKLSAKFIRQQAEGSTERFFHGKESEVLTADFLSAELVDLLRQIKYAFDSVAGLEEPASWADAIVHHHDDQTRKLLSLIVAKGGGVDGADSGVDKGTPGRKQRPGDAYLATAFGIEKPFPPEELDSLRKAVADGLDQLLNQLHLSSDLCAGLMTEGKEQGIIVEDDRVIIGGVPFPIKNAVADADDPPVKPVETISLETLRALRRLVQATFQQGLGETRRAANDVTLWDHAYSVASLYKAALAGMILDGIACEPKEVKWRFFRVGFDGLGLIAKGHKIGDMLGYRDRLEQAQDAARDIVEFDWAIGNEVYRDENGVYFVLPALADAQKQHEYDRDLTDAIRRKVLEVTEGEVAPVVDGEKNGSRGLTRLGPQIAQTDRDVHIPYRAAGQPTWPDYWTDWPQLARFLKDTQQSVEQKPNLGQCDVCVYQHECAVFEPNGRRPQVDGCPVCQARPKCENQVICPACGQRRQGRVQPWLAQGRQSTIWIDEVADRNDRVAVIVGRFDLTHWLDGRFSETYLNTLLSHTLEQWAQEAQKGDLQTQAASLGLSPANPTYPTSIEYLDYILQHANNTQVQVLLRTFFDISISGVPETLSATFERAAEDVAQDVVNLNTLLFRKHPSPARLRRIWRTTESFWQSVVADILDNFTYDQFADPEQPGLHQARTRRIAISAQGVSLPALAYDAQIGPLRLSVYWDGKQFIILDNLQLLLEQTGSGSVEDFRDWLNGQREIRIEEPITGQARARALRGEGENRGRYRLRSSEVLNDNYHPYVTILSSPRTFLALVPGVDAADILQAIYEQYEKAFGKVRNRLPLHLGVVYFHRRSPLYAALDAAQRMLPVGCRDAETWTLKGDAVPTLLSDGRAGVKLEFDHGIAWTVDVTSGDPTVPDDYYPYFLVDADSHAAMTLLVPDPTQSGKRLPLVHARDLKPGDRVRIEPSLFDFEFLDTIGRRFEVSYADGVRRPRAGLAGRRPYYLEHLPEFRRLWRLLSGHGAAESAERKALTATQLSNLETLIGAHALEWRQGDWKTLATDATFREYVRATLANVGKGWWKSLQGDERDFVHQAACEGALVDVIELYRKIMKIKPLGKEVD